jgi:hypothetical protein
VVELRKTVDTRAGRWLLVVMGGLALAALGYRLWNADSTPVGYEDWLGFALGGVQMLLPVLGVLAMTSEWTQRTALVLTVAAIAAVATLVGGAVAGDDVAWGDVPRLLAGALVAMALNVLMGAGFGALLQHTTVAIVAFFVAPALWAGIATPLLGAASRWLDVFAAFGAVSSFDVAGVVGQTVVALGVWVALPLALGVVRSARREVS